MNILINISNITGGGGLQVSNSVCKYLDAFKSYHFIVVFSDSLLDTIQQISNYKNVTSVYYNYPYKDSIGLLTSRNKFLDFMVEKYEVQCVLTLFGPMKWKPKCCHICGFALSQIVIPESPYFSIINWIDLLKIKLRISLWTFLFRRSSDVLFTENEYISQRVRRLFPAIPVYTISNTYNQVFNCPADWKAFSLPKFEGITLLTISSMAVYKNLTIAIEIAKQLIKKDSSFNFRFIFTIERDEFPSISSDLESHFCFVGKVDIESCPCLYEQCDIVFHPTLLECFSAMYVEAMKMGKPIVTTNLAFARGICKDAALYYSPVDAYDAAMKIYDLAHNRQTQEFLVQEGYNQLKTLESSYERVCKLVHLCEYSVNSLEELNDL